MKILTVSVNEISGRNWLVNAGTDTEFIAPMAYSELLENMSQDNPLYDQYISLGKWFKSGNKADKYIPTDEEKISLKVAEIGSYIYSFYPEKKQSQDRGYQAYSQTVIVGVTSQTDTPTTLDALTIEVMGVVLQILEEVITLKDYVASKPAELQEHYEKLVKVGLRLKWTKSCIDEGKLAIAEGREPNYPIYPTFN